MQQNSGKDQTSKRNIGCIENRPKLGVFPFLNDIKSLGQLKAKAERDIADTIAIPVTRSRSHETENESEFVKDKILDDITKYNQIYFYILQIMIFQENPLLNKNNLFLLKTRRETHLFQKQ